MAYGLSVDLVAAGFCSLEEDCCVVDEEEEEEEDDSVLEDGAELALLSFDDSATFAVVVGAAA